MDPANPEDHAQRIKEALFAGKKIEAIKLYREQTKAGLAESKAAMDALERDLRNESSGSFTAPPAPGCGGAAAVLLVVVGVFLAWFVQRH